MADNESLAIRFRVLQTSSRGISCPEIRSPARDPVASGRLPVFRYREVAPSPVTLRSWRNGLASRPISTKTKKPGSLIGNRAFVIFRQTTSYCMMPGSGVQSKLQHPDSVHGGTPRGVGARMRPETGVRPGACSARRSSSAPPPGSRFRARRSRLRRSSGGSRSPGRESRRRR